MKVVNCKIVIFLFLLLLPLFVTSHDTLKDGFTYEIFRIYPPVTVTKQELAEASTLSDLNEKYHSSWVKEYRSVEIMTLQNGIERAVISLDDQLTAEQKELMASADIGSDINVVVRYLPDNNLIHNEVKEMDFSFTVEPDSGARYVGSREELQQYLRKSAIDKIAIDKFGQYQLAAVKFTINENGDIVDAHTFWTSDDTEIDQILLESVCNMPKWEPAKYDGGKRVKQEFVLTVGDLQSCVTNLLNIRQG